MHGRAHRKTVQLRGGAGMHTERQRVWAPSLMRSAVHQTLGGHTHTHTHTHTHECILSREERSTEVTWFIRIGQSFRCLFTFGRLPCFLPHTSLVHDPPQDACATVCWDGSHHWGLWVHACAYHACASFLTPRKPFCAWADRDVFLDLRSGHRISLL